jgi:hypothetical protein
MSLLFAILAGFLIFVASVLVMRLQKKRDKLPQPPSLPQNATDDEKRAANEKQQAIANATLQLKTCWALLGLGVATLFVITFRQCDSLWQAAMRAFSIMAAFPVDSVSLTVVTRAAYIVPLVYVFAVFFLTPNTQKVNNDTRNKYLDAVKTLITACGLTVGIVISTSLKPQLAPDGWTSTVKDAVLYLAICIGFSVITLFILSLLYDRAEERTVTRWELVVVAPFVYYALVTFFLGFITLVRLAFLLQ